LKKLLELIDLQRYYPIKGGILRRTVGNVKAVDGVTLDIHRNECLGLVGESGCGKTTTGKAVIRLEKPTGGQLWYHHENGDSVNITGLSIRALKKAKVRGKLQMVFQDPTTSLDPRMLIKHIISEPIKQVEKLSSRAMEEKVVKLLEEVGLSSMHLLRYPHEFSGGQRQRIAVARAISTNPEFIVLDEPTSALDVSVQAQILNLLMDLQQRLGLTYMFVTHHLLVVKYIAQRTAVMYLGKLMEVSPTKQLFEQPFHPYTHALLSGIPVPEIQEKKRRIILSGDVPNPANPPKGCRFNTRCPFSIEMCRSEEPRLEEVEPGHTVACHRKLEVPRLVADAYGNAA
jgi:oligopeptide/dipeptide ABC transporter ATP-binding protein